MAKGKRMVDNHHNKSTHNRFKEEKKFNFKKFFTIFLIIIVLAILGYIIYKYVPTFIAKNNSDNADFKNVLSTDIKDSKVIEGLESVSITSINISISDKDSSIIEFHFKNTSNEVINKNKAHFYALDSENNIIFGMPLNIPELAANSETTYRVLCTSNLANSTDYKISIE